MLSLLLAPSVRASAEEEPPPAPAQVPAPSPTPLPATVPVVVPPEPPLFGYDGGVFVRTRDGKYSLYVNGFAQLLYALTVDKGTFNNNFDLGLGRIAFSGAIFDPRLTYFFQLQGSTFGNGNGITMLDWNMKYTFNPCFYVKAGRQLLMYSRQFDTHPGNLLFADLSPADYAFNLPRSIGLTAGGSVSRFSWDLFVANSVRALDSGTQANVGDSIAAGVRVELAILQPYGYVETVPTADSPPQLSIGGAFAYNPVADGSGFQNLANGDQTVNATVDLGFRWQRLTIQSAFYFRRKVNHELDNSYGYYAQAGVYVVRNRFELAARASSAFFDQPLAAPLGMPAGGSADRRLSEYSGGANLYLFGHGCKLQTDYTYVLHEAFAGGASNGVHRYRVQLQVLF